MKDERERATMVLEAIKNAAPNGFVTAFKFSQAMRDAGLDESVVLPGLEFALEKGMLLKKGGNYYIVEG